MTRPISQAIGLPARCDRHVGQQRSAAPKAAAARLPSLAGAGRNLQSSSQIIRSISIANNIHIQNKQKQNGVHAENGQSRSAGLHHGQQQQAGSGASIADCCSYIIQVGVRRWRAWGSRQNSLANVAAKK